VLNLPEIEKRLTELGMEVETSTPAQFNQRMTADLKRWKEIMDAIGYKATQQAWRACGPNDRRGLCRDGRLVRRQPRLGFLIACG
jgi:hypothetical protein